MIPIALIIHFSKQTLHWLTVYPEGQESVQVKLKRTIPDMQPVQLSMVPPKQNVQLPSQVSQVLVVLLGKVAGGQTSRQ